MSEARPPAVARRTLRRMQIPKESALVLVEPAWQPRFHPAPARKPRSACALAATAPPAACAAGPAAANSAAASRSAALAVSSPPSACTRPHEYTLCMTLIR